MPVTSAAAEIDQIPVGNYDVVIYLNGYDENGTIFIRSIDLGLIKVVA